MSYEYEKIFSEETMHFRHCNVCDRRMSFFKTGFNIMEKDTGTDWKLWHAQVCSKECGDFWILQHI